MLPTSDRRYIYKLRRDECLELLQKLGIEMEGSVASFRVKLMKTAKTATPEQIIIFQEGKHNFLRAREDSFIKTFVYNLPTEECKELLDEFGIAVQENDGENRTLLEQNLNNREGVEKENWVDYAKEFCKDLEEKAAAPAHTTTVRNEVQHPQSPSVDDTIYVDPEDNINEEFERPEPIHSKKLYNNYRHSPSEISLLMDQVCKWGITFNGKGSPEDALQFLERLKTRAECYQISEGKLHLVLPVLLRDDAESWYQCNKDEWSDWKSCEQSFKLYFLPSKMRDEMIDEVRSYKQQKGQSMTDYIVKLKSRMRLVPTMTTSEQLERVYKNMSIDYQLNIKRSEFCNLQELIRLGKDYEEKLKKQSRVLSRVNSFQMSNTAVNYNIEGVSTRSEDSRPRREIELAGKQFVAVLDTGATTSCVNKSVKNHLQTKGIRWSSLNVITRLANGANAFSNKVYGMELKMGNKLIHQNFIVLDRMKEDVILGIDALEKLGFKLIESNVCNREQPESFPIVTAINDNFKAEYCGNLKFELVGSLNKNLEDTKNCNNVLAEISKIIPLSENILNCKWLRTKVNLISASPEKFPDFMLVNGQLFRKFMNKNSREISWKFCVGQSLRKKTLEKYQEPYFGIKKTIRKIQTKFYWPGLIRDVIKFVRSCKNVTYDKTKQKCVDRFKTPSKIKVCCVEKRLVKNNLIRKPVQECEQTDSAALESLEENNRLKKSKGKTIVRILTNGIYNKFEPPTLKKFRMCPSDKRHIESQELTKFHNFRRRGWTSSEGQQVYRRNFYKSKGEAANIAPVFVGQSHVVNSIPPTIVELSCPPNPRTITCTHLKYLKEMSHKHFE